MAGRAAAASHSDQLLTDPEADMLVKLVVLACACACASAVWNGPQAGGQPAALYPAGVSPQACPNFPNCANPAVAANPGAPAPWNAAPAWNAGPQGGPYNAAPVPQWNPGNQNALDRGGYTGDGDYHGEGLAEALAPGFGGGNQWNNGDNGQWNGGNQWNQPAPAWNQPAPAWGGQQGAPGVPAGIPAGVDPRSCPNYPFCH